MSLPLTKVISACLVALLISPWMTVHANSDISYVGSEPYNTPAQDIPRLPRCEDDPDTIYPCEITRQWDVEALASHDETFWVEDDTTFVVAYHQQAQRVAIVGDLPTEISPVPDSEWWAIAIRILRLDEATITVGILPLIEGQWRINDVEFETFRGPNSIPQPEVAEPLQGTLHTISLSGNGIRSRNVTVYLPPDHDPTQGYPVVYMTDGGAVETLGPTIEPLIMDGTLPSLVLVGVHSAQPQSRNDNPRAEEYLPGLTGGQARFAAHEAFFIQTVIPWAEDTLGASTDRQLRAIFGFSDGAAFAAYMGQAHADIFGNSLPFSLGWNIRWQSHDAYPVRHYLVAGVLEPHFHIHTRIWHEEVVDHDEDVMFTDRVSGHSFEMWQGEFPKALVWVFGAEDESPS